MDEISERAKKAWREGKERKTSHQRPNLTTGEKIVFLKLVAKMASGSEFDRKLGLSSSDINHYRKELDIESQYDARRVIRKLESENIALIEARITEETRRQQEAADVANVRLEEIRLANAERESKKVRNKIDVNDIRQEDAERQRRFNRQNAMSPPEPDQDWHLPMDGSDGQRQEAIDRFRRDISSHGVRFTCNKYNALARQVRFEAHRLGLNIDWDNVRR